MRVYSPGKSIHHFTMNQVVNCVAYSKGIKVANIDIEGIKEVFEKTEHFVWVGLHEPNEEMLSLFQNQFNLHDLAIEDAQKAHQRPKIERYGDTLFIVLRTAKVSSMLNQIDFGETHFFVGHRFLITVRHGSSISYTEVRNRCESTPHLLSIGEGFALYAVMDSIVDQYFPIVESLEEGLLSIEDKVFRDKPSRKTTEDIYLLKRQLLEVKRAVSPLLDICNRLMRFDIKLISEETQPYFRDIYDHAVRINEMVDHTRELLNTALEANFSLLSIAQNEVSKKFAGWAAIIAVPTMVAGFYGMNFRNMPELGWHYGYPAVVAGTITMCLIIFFQFRRSGWL